MCLRRKKSPVATSAQWVVLLLNGSFLAVYWLWSAVPVLVLLDVKCVMAEVTEELLMTLARIQEIWKRWIRKDFQEVATVSSQIGLACNVYHLYSKQDFLRNWTKLKDFVKLHPATMSKPIHPQLHIWLQKESGQWKMTIWEHNRQKNATHSHSVSSSVNCGVSSLDRVVEHCFAIQDRDQPSLFQVGLFCGCTNQSKDYRFYQTYNASFVFKSRVVVNPTVNCTECTRKRNGRFMIASKFCDQALKYQQSLPGRYKFHRNHNEAFQPSVHCQGSLGRSGMTGCCLSLLRSDLWFPWQWEMYNVPEDLRALQHIWWLCNFVSSHK